jgi:LPXTG-motif cell wall-anchored protein
MKRAGLVAAAVAVVPIIAMTAAPAVAGRTTPADISISHSPMDFTVGDPGAFTVTLSGISQSGSYDYTVTDNVPPSMTIDSVDQGPYNCEANDQAHMVTCTDNANLTGTSEAFTIHVTPSQAGTFTDTASYDYSTPTTTSRLAQRPSVVGGSASDMVTVNPKATPSPTPTPTKSQSPKPTHKPTHHPTRHPTHSPKPTVKPTRTERPTLPDTGGSDLGVLGVIGAVLVGIGVVATVLGRRRT